jgi:DNA (cytosine-5)-methyltransferase 1
MPTQAAHEKSAKSSYAAHFPALLRRGSSSSSPPAAHVAARQRLANAISSPGQHSLGLDDEIRVDLFCGGGGASEGIEIATGEPVTIAVNHDAAAIAMHMVNHPLTEHFQAGVHDVCPREATRGRQVGHLHASPDCTHFSQAKGGQPRSRSIRSLSWIVLRWAGMVRPRMITMENVVQMQSDWGRLVAKRDPATGRVIKLDGSIGRPGEVVPINEQFLIPDPKHRGKTFQRFVRCLERLGYTVDYRALVAADYGAPTTRERLYLVARCDGLPIVWPEQTHFRDPKPGQKAWRGAHECIDWTLGATSIFKRKKELATATLRRTARGIKRFVIDTEERFFVPSEALANRNANHHATRSDGLAPVMIQAGHGEGSGATKRRSHGSKRATAPLGTITASAGGHAVAIATLIQTGFGERPGQLPRAPGLSKPLGTVVAGGSKHALVTAFLAQANDGFNTTLGHDVRRPMSTITNSGSQQQLVTANLVTLRRHSVGQPALSPLPTIVARGQHHAVLECTLSQEEHSGALRVARFLRDHLNDAEAHPEPLKPVTITIDGVVYAIVDIGLRMLQPHELYAGQGFPKNYIHDRDSNGKPFTKRDQIRMCGNSVSPVVMAAITAANEWRGQGRTMLDAA